jgi:hypothetical protein
MARSSNRTAFGWRLFGCAALVGACAARAPEPQPSSPPLPSATLAPVVTAPRAKTSPPASPLPAAAESLTLEAVTAGPTTDPPPLVEIKFPIAVQAIVIPKALGYKVRVKVEHWPLARTGNGVELVLDANAPRRVERLDGLALADLLPARVRRRAPGRAAPPGPGRRPRQR